MSVIIKGNSALLAFDSSPAFSTGEKLGLFFAQLLQDVELSVSPAKTQTKQIGSQELSVDSINFSPDIVCNLSYLTRQDFETDRMLGMIFRPSGQYLPIFSGASDFSFNSYLFFSENQSDLVNQIINNDSFSGINVIGIGNAYLTNVNISLTANELPRTSCSLIASNINCESLNGNYTNVPSINLESGNLSGAASIFLDPGQVSRIQTGDSSGILNTWSATFQPILEDSQIPNQKLSEAVINSIEISLSIDRENEYGFGSNHVYGRKIKYPIQGSLSINGVVSDYYSGDFSSLMESERRYDIEIYNRDPQDYFLSGASLNILTGLSETQHLVKNRWLKFNNCTISNKRDIIGANKLLEFSNQFDVQITENRGMNYKQGTPTSIDDVYLHSSDWHRVVSRDGYSPIHYPFLQYFESDCSLANLLSSNKEILMTRDNFIEGWKNPTCSLSNDIIFSLVGGGGWELYLNGGLIQQLSGEYGETLLFSGISQENIGPIELKCYSVPSGYISVESVTDIYNNLTADIAKSDPNSLPYSVNIDNITAGNYYSGEVSFSNTINVFSPYDLYFDEGSVTTNQTATLRWSHDGFYDRFIIYRDYSSPDFNSNFNIVGETSNYFYEDNSLDQPLTYTFYLTAEKFGIESTSSDMVSISSIV